MVVVESSFKLLLESSDALLLESTEYLERETDSVVYALILLESGDSLLIESEFRLALESNFEPILGSVNIGVRGLSPRFAVRGLTI